LRLFRYINYDAVSKDVTSLRDSEETEENLFVFFSKTKVRQLQQSLLEMDNV